MNKGLGKSARATSENGRRQNQKRAIENLNRPRRPDPDHTGLGILRHTLLLRIRIRTRWDSVGIAGFGGAAGLLRLEWDYPHGNRLCAQTLGFADGSGLDGRESAEFEMCYSELRLGVMETEPTIFPRFRAFRIFCLCLFVICSKN